jgi:Rod binding domain-containing protein
MKTESHYNLKPASQLHSGNTRADLAPMPSQDGALRKQAEIFVASAFFGTLLKQMRESPFKSELFSGGRGGQAFGSLYDQQMAERMSRGAGSKLVNSIVRKIEASAAYRRQSTTTKTLIPGGNRAAAH